MLSMWEEHVTPITALAPHQVFVFGSNRGERNVAAQRQSKDGGFHGAGAAGVAWRGTPGHPHRGHPDHWSKDSAFLAAIQAPYGDPARIGKWAVMRVCHGPMQGREGKSYAIYTVTKPGLKRSIPLTEIGAQFARFLAFAQARPHLEFLVTPVGEGLAGYAQRQLDPLWQGAGTLPQNVRFIRIVSPG